MTNCAGYLRAGQIARAFGLSERTVRRWISSGQVRSMRIGGARLIAKVDLDRWIAKRHACLVEDDAPDENEDETGNY